MKATKASRRDAHAQAAAGFETAARLKPDWTEAWNNLAAALGKRQDYVAAIAAARNALRLRPDDANAHQALAALQSNLFDRASLQEGLHHAFRALQRDPSLGEAHRNAAILSRKLGDPAGAEALVEVLDGDDGRHRRGRTIRALDRKVDLPPT